MLTGGRVVDDEVLLVVVVLDEEEEEVEAIVEVDVALDAGVDDEVVVWLEDVV